MKEEKKKYLPPKTIKSKKVAQQKKVNST